MMFTIIRCNVKWYVPYRYNVIVEKRTAIIVKKEYTRRKREIHMHSFKLTVRHFRYIYIYCNYYVR